MSSASSAPPAPRVSGRTGWKRVSSPNPCSLVQAEGYVSPPRADGLYTVLGSGLLSYTDRPDEMDTALRMRTCGTEAPMVTGARPADPDGAMRDLTLRLGCPVE
ncbi:MAG: hypothetical protein R3D80_03160 [Paracoccaceae bacterium]